MMITGKANEKEGFSLKKEDQELMERLSGRLSRLTQDLERANVAEYIQLMRSPLRLIWVNLVAGLARGVGIALGATLLSSFILYLFFRLAELNLPVIGEFIARLVMIVTNHL